MDIWSISLSTILDQEQELARLLPLVSSELQTKIMKYRKLEDQLRSLCGELLLLAYASVHLGISHSRLVKKYNAYGKPELAFYPSLHYNISHSGDWVVAAFASDPVGIDIESIVPINMSIAERFFSASEVDVLKNAEKEHQQSLFYDLWTLKESYIKAEGAGLSIPFDSFSFHITDPNHIELHRSDCIDTSWFFKKYDIASSYALAVCGRQPHFPEHIEIKKWDTLVHHLLKQGSL